MEKEYSLKDITKTYTTALCFTANGVAKLHLVIVQLDLKCTGIILEELGTEKQFTIAIVTQHVSW